MNGWVVIGTDTYVKPVDDRFLYVVQVAEDKVSYECRLKCVDTTRKGRLIGTGDTPRQAAQLTTGWDPYKKEQAA